MRNSSKWFYVSLILAIVLGLAVILVWTQWPLPGKEAAIALAHAFIIASFLALTVDRFVKDRLLREVSQDVSKYLIGYGLPLEVQDRIRELMSTSIIRSNYEARYQLAGATDRPRLEVETSFVVENYSHRSQDYQQHLAFQRCENPIIHEMTCLTRDAKAKYTISDASGAVEGSAIKFLGKPIQIPPHEKGVEYRVIARYSIQPQENADFHAFGGITRGATLVAHGEGYDFEQESIAKPDVECDGRWEFNRLFMPGEHLRFSWRRRAEPAAPTQEA